MSPNTTPSAPRARAALRPRVRASPRRRAWPRRCRATAAGASPRSDGAIGVVASGTPRLVEPRGRPAGEPRPSGRHARRRAEAIVAVRADDHELARRVLQQPGDVVAAEAVAPRAPGHDDEPVAALPGDRLTQGVAERTPAL